MKNIWICAVAAAALLGLGGCATSRSDKQDDTPPRLVERNKKIAWDRAEAFGPVPLQLASLAALHCAALDSEETKWVPEGFHAKAQDLQGQTLPGGGYFCLGRSRNR